MQKLFLDMKSLKNFISLSVNKNFKDLNIDGIGETQITSINNF